MANRRMFSLKVVDTDAFLEMSLSTQALYFHLAMRADDDGFVSNPKKILRMLGSQEDELKMLFHKKFVLPFESGVCVIKHWRIHNYIQADRYTPTQWVEEKEKLFIDDKTQKYSLNKGDNKMYTECIQNGYTGKDRLELGKSKDRDTMSDKSDAFDKFWVKYPKKELKKKSKEIWQRKKLDTHLEAILEFIEKARKTDRWQKGYIKQPPAFLNGECWNDDLSSYGGAKQTEVYQNKNQSDFLEKVKSKVQK